MDFRSCTSFGLDIIHAIDRQNDFGEKDMIGLTVNKAKVLMRENINEDISTKRWRRIEVSYSCSERPLSIYRMAPGQLFDTAQDRKSKEMLSNPGRSIKKLPMNLSLGYQLLFFKTFKEKKTG